MAADEAAGVGMMSTLVDVSGLSLTIAGRPIIRGLTLQIASGRRVGFTGPSGCGKTTLLRAIASRSLKKPSSAVHFNVSAERIGYVAQRGVMLPWFSLERNVELWATANSEARKTTCRDVLAIMELGAAARTFPEHLSGGERQRARLAAAVALRPALYCADEPLTEVGIQQRWRLLKEWSRDIEERQAGLLLVSHDIDTLLYLCDEVIILGGDDGAPAEVVERVPIDLRSHPRDPSNLTKPYSTEVRALLMNRLIPDTPIGSPVVPMSAR